MTQEFVIRVTTEKPVFRLDVLKAIIGERHLPESVDHVEIVGITNQPPLGRMVPKRAPTPVPRESRRQTVAAAGGKG